MRSTSLLVAAAAVVAGLIAPGTAPTVNALPTADAAQAHHDHNHHIYPYPGFVLQAPSELHLDFAESNVSKEVKHPGQLLSPNETTALPALSVDHRFFEAHHHYERSKYIFMYVDPSVYGTNGSEVALHVIVTNVTLSRASVDDALANLTYAADDVLAPYLAPTPTEGESVHRYTQLLFAQPQGWTFPAAYAAFLPLNSANLTNRLGLHLTRFTHAAKLREPVAATYYTMDKILKPGSA